MLSMEATGAGATLAMITCVVRHATDPSNRPNLINVLIARPLTSTNIGIPY